MFLTSDKMLARSEEKNYGSPDIPPPSLLSNQLLMILKKEATAGITDHSDGEKLSGSASMATCRGT